MNAPAGKIMTTHGKHSEFSVTGMTVIVNSSPAPNSSRTLARATSAPMKPTLIPSVSRMDGRTGFLDANASWRPRMMQLTTMRGT